MRLTLLDYGPTVQLDSLIDSPDDGPLLQLYVIDPNNGPTVQVGSLATSPAESPLLQLQVAEVVALGIVSLDVQNITSNTDYALQYQIAKL